MSVMPGGDAPNELLAAAKEVVEKWL